MVTEAKQQSVPIAYRRGGGANLGLRGLAPEKAPTSKWVAKQVPKWWGRDELERVLREQCFSGVMDLQEPRTRWHGWLFRAQAPKATMGDNAEALAINLKDEENPITIRPWTLRRNSEASPKLKSRDAWIRTTTEVKAEPEQQEGQLAKRARTDAEAKDEGMNVDEGTEKKENGTDATTEPKLPKEEAAQDDDNKRRKQTTTKAPDEGTREGRRDRPARGPGGLEIWDLGGNGDCGYRALAAAAAMSENKVGAAAVEANINKMSEILRGKIIKLYEKDLKWQESWVYDDEATEVTEAGKIPTTARVWLAAIKRPRRWMCHRMTHGAARIVNEWHRPTGKGGPGDS